MPRINPFIRPTYQFAGLLAVLACLFFMGGSSRNDVQSLTVLYPAAILACGAALLTINSGHCHQHRWLLAGTVGLFGLILLYLTPLPISMPNLSQGHLDLAIVRGVTGTLSSQDTFTIALADTWEPVFFLSAPLAVILFGIQLDYSDLRLTVPLVIAIGVVSGLIAILQTTGAPDGPMYFYRITNTGGAVGFFANRNHAAVFLACLFPMLVFAATRSNSTQQFLRNPWHLASMAIAVFLVPLVLVTGSRSGIVTAIIGLAGALFLYLSLGKSDRRSKVAKAPHLLIAAMAVICLAAVTAYFSRAEAIDRLFFEGETLDYRTDYWVSSLPMFMHYYPFGFGPGSFVVAFQNAEPTFLLSGAHLNRLHNDWLEIVLTYGIPGIFAILAGCACYVRRTYVLWMRMDGARSAVAMGRMASVVIVIMAIASISDYPLRTPAMAGLAALVLVWFVHACDRKPVLAKQINY